MVTKERKNEIQKKYYRNHAEYYKEYRRKYWQKHRVEILKLDREKTQARKEIRKQSILSLAIV